MKNDMNTPKNRPNSNVRLNSPPTSPITWINWLQSFQIPHPKLEAATNKRTHPLERIASLAMLSLHHHRTTPATTRKISKTANHNISSKTLTALQAKGLVICTTLPNSLATWQITNRGDKLATTIHNNLLPLVKIAKKLAPVAAAA